MMCTKSENRQGNIRDRAGRGREGIKAVKTIMLAFFLCLYLQGHAAGNVAALKDKTVAADYTEEIIGKDNVRKLESKGVSKKSIDAMCEAVQMEYGILVKDSEIDENIEEVFMKSIEEDRRNYIAINFLADHYTRRGEWKKAEETYLEAIRIEPQNEEAYSRLGLIYSTVYGERDKAMGIYNEIIRRFPESPTGYEGISYASNKGEEIIRNGKKAIELYEKKINLRKNNVPENGTEHPYPNEMNIMELYDLLIFRYLVSEGREREAVKYFLEVFPIMEKMNREKAGGYYFESLEYNLQEIKKVNMKIKDKNSKLYEENKRRLDDFKVLRK